MDTNMFGICQVGDSKCPVPSLGQALSFTYAATDRSMPLKSSEMQYFIFAYLYRLLLLGLEVAPDEEL